jgi:hypothetical protein
MSLGDVLILFLHLITDSCSPTGLQLVAFLEAITQSKTITSLSDVSLASLALLKCGTTHFPGTVATLLGVDSRQTSHGCATEVKRILKMCKVNLKFTDRSKGIFDAKYDKT